MHGVLNTCVDILIGFGIGFLLAIPLIMLSSKWPRLMKGFPNFWDFLMAFFSVWAVFKVPNESHPVFRAVFLAGLVVWYVDARRRELRRDRERAKMLAEHGNAGRDGTWM